MGTVYKTRNSKGRSLRGIDHLVLVTGDLDHRRERYTAMGFTVAPNGRHPFGTENANIYFNDGTMIETLAIANTNAYSTAIEDDNTFIINDAAYRQKFGDTGFSPHCCDHGRRTG